MPRLAARLRPRLAHRGVQHARRARRLRGRRARPSRGKQSGAPWRSSASSAAACARVVDLGIIGERTIAVDCDVTAGRRRHAHGEHHRRLRGACTRCALKIKDLLGLHEVPLFDSIAAVSVGHRGRRRRCSTSTTRRTRRRTST
ncbi:MAG: hypothetical protein MZV63_34295 [Marinilabiliales bacterium]|nr:hypothetical protein [Marinilabiliales bacterium]